MPIKPLPNVVTLQEDITTERCRQVMIVSSFQFPKSCRGENSFIVL